MNFIDCVMVNRIKLVKRISAATFAAIGLFAGAVHANEVEAVTADKENAATESCLYARHVRNINVINDEMLVLRGTADRYWFSRLPSKCVGLKGRMHLVVNQYGSKYCRNDRFEARESSGGFYTSCRFGEFEPISSASVDALKVAAN